MKHKMKHLQAMIAVALCIIFAMNITSCSKDDSDEPDNKSLFGIWDELPGGEDFPMLITEDCLIMNDGQGGAALFDPYLNASYETLERRFAPNDEFFIYRYDSKNDVYILYSGDKFDEKGNLTFHVRRAILLRATFSKNLLEGQYQWIDLDNKERYVTREELLSNSKYASVPSNIKIDFDEIRFYERYK